MSKRHQASRRRTYGRRQHEIRQRRDGDWRAGEVERDLAEESSVPAEVATADHRAPRFGATWLGFE
jgi:hypothetical protein